MSNDNPGVSFQLSFAELTKLLDLFEKLVEGFGRAASLPRNERRELSQAISETAEMIDTILTTVKQRISNIIREIRMEKPREDVKAHILELDDAEEWESRYREFRMCEPLLNASMELRDDVWSRLRKWVVVRDIDELERTVNDFIHGERMAGEFVSALLRDLAELGKEVHERPEFVLSKLTEARDDIQKYRNHFIEIEQRMRKSI